MSTTIGALSGELIGPADAQFDEYKEFYALGSPPSVVVRPHTAADVAAAIRYARQEGLAVSVRSGGHTAATLTNGGAHLLVDLAAMQQVEVDGTRVRVAGGASWGQVAAALAPHGLAISSGDTTTVGVGGLTLGGGIGWMVRGRGLASDSLVEAQVVTAAGEIVTASADEHADLFWALRGGGGNFGVVTRFTFEAHPLTQVVGGTIRYREENLEGLLRAWRDVMRAAPEELNTTFVAMPAFAPGVPGGYQLFVCYAGDDLDAALAFVAPLLEFDTFESHDLARKPYADMLEEPHKPEGAITVAGNNLFARDFSDDLIDAVAASYRALGMSVLMIRSLGGALNRVHPDATAFGIRDSEVLIISVAFLPPDDAAAMQAARQQWVPFEPHSTGSYLNFLEGPSADAVGRVYPPATLERLRQVKNEYDPENLFRCNHNIAPAPLVE